MKKKDNKTKTVKKSTKKIQINLIIMQTKQKLKKVNQQKLVKLKHQKRAKINNKQKSIYLS